MSDLDVVVNPSSIVQIEIQVSHLDKAAAFYLGAFGWEKVPADIHGHIILAVPKDCLWGISLVARENSGAGLKSSVVIYFGVDEPERVAKQVERAGGSIKLGPVSLPAYGKIWQVADPDGNRFGLFQRRYQKAVTREQPNKGSPSDDFN